MKKNKKRLKDKIESKIHIPRMDIPSLLMNALDSWNRLKQTNLKMDEIDDYTLNHICINYIRHKMKDYNQNNRDYFRGKNEEIYLDWFEKINIMIGETYPFLKKECESQIRHKRNSYARGVRYENESSVLDK